MYPKSGSSPVDACDFNMNTHLAAVNPFPGGKGADRFDKSFYVSWSNTQTINAVMFDAWPQTVYGDVFVTSTFPFDHTDPALLALSNIYPDGIFNLPSAFLGSYLVFISLDTEEPADFALREIRVWSRPDLAQTGSVVNGISTLVGVVPAYTSNYSASTSAFYIDLGSSKYLDGVWLRLEGNDMLSVSYGTTIPGSSPFTTAVSRQPANNDEEWWVQIGAYARYIFICQFDGVDCIISASFKLRRVAALEGVDPCLT
jgi:hypothetical protein